MPGGSICDDASDYWDELKQVERDLAQLKQAVLDYLDAPPSGVVDHYALEQRLRHLVGAPNSLAPALSNPEASADA